MTGPVENSALDARVAWVRDLLDRVTVDGREEHAVAGGRHPTTVLAGRIQEAVGSGGRIRTYDQAVNSRPLYH